MYLTRLLSQSRSGERERESHGCSPCVASEKKKTPAALSHAGLDTTQPLPRTEWLTSESARSICIPALSNFALFSQPKREVWKKQPGRSHAHRQPAANHEPSNKTVSIMHKDEYDIEVVCTGGPSWRSWLRVKIA